MKNSSLSPCARPLLGAAIALLLAAPHPAAAEINVQVNGKQVQFPEARPVESGGRVLIPLRAVVESLGADIKWDARTQTVSGSKGEHQFTLQIGSRNATLNGVSKTLDVPAQLMHGNTMVPLRFVAEALGAEVEWNAAAQRILITSNDTGGTDVAGAADRITGEVVAVRPSDNPPVISVRVNGVRNTYAVTPDTVILRGEPGKRGATVDLDQVQPGDQVRLRLNRDASAAEVIEASGIVKNPNPPVAGIIEGDVEDIRSDAGSRRVTVRTDTGRQIYDVPEDAPVMRRRRQGASERADFRDIQVGDRIRVTPDRLDRQGRRAARLEAIEPDDLPLGSAIEGDVEDIRTEGGVRRVTVRTDTGRRIYEVPDDAPIMRRRRQGTSERADFRDIQRGDRIRVTPDRLDRQGRRASRLEAMEADSAPAASDIEGDVVDVRSDGGVRTVTVRTPTGRQTFDVPDDASILRGRRRGATERADLGDVQVGDRIRVTPDRQGRRATRLEATEASIPVKNGQVTGEVVSIRETDPPSITVRSAGIRTTYDISPDTVLFRKVGTGKSTRAELREIQTGDQVTLRLDQNGTSARTVDATAAGRAADTTPVPPVPAGDLKITSFTHDAGGTLGSGSQVRVTLVGPPGGQGSFDAGNLAQNVPLKEDPQQRGRYTGSFTIPKGMTAKDIPVIGQVKVGNRTSPLIQAGTLLSVDSQPPVVSEMAPADRAMTNNQQPDIYAEVSDGDGSGIDTNSIRVSVRGKDVTDQVKLRGRLLLYTPKSALTPGPVPVTVTLKDLAGNASQASWSFTVQQGTPVLLSVTHDADKPLKAGDVLTVTAKGTPKSKGNFSVGNVARTIPLRETSPGVYTGTYTVRPGDEGQKLPVTVDFLSATGERVKQEATAPVNVVAQEQKAPVITAPTNGLQLGSQLVVEGTAAPGTKVVVDVKYTGKAVGILALEGTFGSQEVTADKNGRWATKPFDVRLVAGVKRPELVITAVSTDAAGTRSKPTVAIVTTK